MPDYSAVKIDLIATFISAQNASFSPKNPATDTFYFDAGALRFIDSLKVPTLGPWTPRPPTPTSPPPTPYAAP
jgi:hypothetical protein